MTDKERNKIIQLGNIHRMENKLIKEIKLRNGEVNNAFRMENRKIKLKGNKQY